VRNAPGAGGPGGPPPALWEPIEADPPCSRCTPDLTSAPAPHRTPCRSCGAARVDLLELASAELHVPPVTMVDCERALDHSRATVGKGELSR
jgi:hypothetical protein